MHLAASPVPLSRENAFGGPAASRSFPWHLNAASDKCGLLPPGATISQPMQTGIFWRSSFWVLWSCLC